MSETDLPFDNSPWVLPVYKDKGPTSFDVIRSLKKPIFSILGKGKGRRKLKVGHFGTLDPFADGLLLVGTGKALKMVSHFQQEMTKTYLGKGTFAFSTDTGDSEGERLEQKGEYTFNDKRPSIEELQKCADQFIGAYEQRPPYFSAVKHEGKPLYDWAREGVFIEKEPVHRVIHCFDILEDLGGGEFLFRAEVSSGTYIRGLWCDLAEKLGLDGHLLELKREKWGQTDLSIACKGPFDELIKESFYRIDYFWDLSKIELSAEDASKFIQGQYLKNDGHLEDRVWVYGPNDQLLGLGGPVNEKGDVFLKVTVNLS